MAQGNVEVWLMSLMLMAQKSLHGVIRTASMAVTDGNFQMVEFLESYPAQVNELDCLIRKLVNLILKPFKIGIQFPINALARPRHASHYDG